MHLINVSCNCYKCVRSNISGLCVPLIHDGFGPVNLCRTVRLPGKAVYWCSWR